ncbi:LysM peptidoglycan-binding domain-containing M23 family metallopeptidase [Deinococcus xianganensis]|uniref:Peptidoglycan DD-metalloendopeptidase family protein n=1 Tax=Deinococcus xianganensis TaxID=1507289 RepID=A0A6I4YJC3_9DEIO|nr:M23 family metallopeptidase [Deinococcus xianganensis]MXV19844.1 peptidoglycan DD-metalloendopeptidase family protein [Deinococcus xianganensis]
MTRRTLAALVLLTALPALAAPYVVRAGDTLYSIARANGTTVDALLQLNKLPGSALEVGQTLQLPARGAVPPAATGKPGLPAPLPAGQLAPTPATARIAGVNITVPSSLRMGDAFLLGLSGERAAQATVRFPSEVGEDVRMPNEVLRPIGGAGQFVVVGRVVLGKTTPVVYEVSLDGQLVRGRIPVLGLEDPIQHLNLPPSVSKVLVDPARAAEDALVEKAYARRTPQAWSRPFAPALKGVAPTSSSFGQPRTYVAGGPVAYHFGTDYPAKAGTPVLAVNDGTVVIAGRYPVRGGLVVIDHGAGVVSLYFHQSRVTAKVGQRVKRGDKVGEVGNTGLSAGSHLHLEIRVRGEGTNPAGWTGRLWPR